MPIIATHIDAIDALNDVAACLDGLAHALSLQASVEGDALAHAAADVLDAKIGVLRGIAEWLEADKLNKLAEAHQKNAG